MFQRLLIIRGGEGGRIDDSQFIYLKKILVSRGHSLLYSSFKFNAVVYKSSSAQNNKDRT